jgi:hypothetical protein
MCAKHPWFQSQIGRIQPPWWFPAGRKPKGLDGALCGFNNLRAGKSSAELCEMGRCDSVSCWKTL